MRKHCAYFPLQSRGAGRFGERREKTWSRQVMPYSPWCVTRCLFTRQFLMSYDLKAFCRDLQDRLSWLFKEVARLQEENERLLQENQALREEATLSRLFRELGDEAQTEMPAPADTNNFGSGVPPEAMAFFRYLPESLDFANYFEAADAYGIEGDQARDWMLIFFRESLLEHRGRVLRKLDPNPFPVRVAR